MKNDPIFVSKDLSGDFDIHHIPVSLVTSLRNNYPEINQAFLEYISSTKPDKISSVVRQGGVTYVRLISGWFNIEQNRYGSPEWTKHWEEL